MSTSDLPDGISEFAPNAASLGLPGDGGLPDVATIARLANDFFKDVPINEQVAAPVAAAPSDPAILTEEQLRSLPATLTAPDPIQAAEGVISRPGITGGLSASDFSNTANFSFLQEARSIFVAAESATRKVPPAPTSLSTLKIPYETEPRDFPGTFSGVKAPQIPTSVDDLAAPQLPGVSLRAQDFSRFGSFSFLDEANPIDLANAQPPPAGSSGDFGALPFSDLSSIPFDVNAIRRDFPILQEKINGGEWR